MTGFILFNPAGINFAHTTSSAFRSFSTATLQPPPYFFPGSSGSGTHVLPANSITQKPASGKKDSNEMRAMLPAISLSRQAGLPNITISSSMDIFTADVGSSQEQFYQVGGSGFSAGQTITLNVNDLSGSFTISSIDSGYGTTVSLTANTDGSLDESILVKYAPAAGGSHSATINHSADGAETRTLTVDGNATALPVKWAFFSARRVKETIMLEWTTASEKYNSHFDVEISKNPVDGFKKVGRINSKVGSSMQATPYSFEYQLGAEAGTFYFRLKQVDIDNTFSYSQIIAIETLAKSGAAVGIIANPVTASSQIAITTAEAGKLNMVVLDVNGAEVYSKAYELESGEHNVDFFLNEKTPTGLYILTTEFKGEINRQKLFKK